MNDSQFGRIALIGFGEAGQAFAQGLANAAGILSAYDVKSDDPAQKAGIDAIYKSSGVSGFAAPQGALSGATLVFCLVPADQSRIAARAAAPFLPRGALWLDGTSTAPESKREAAAVIQNAGGRYVDVAIMAPVHPRLHRTPYCWRVSLPLAPGQPCRPWEWRHRSPAPMWATPRPSR